MHCVLPFILYVGTSHVNKIYINVNEKLFNALSYKAFAIVSNYVIFQIRLSDVCLCLVFSPYHLDREKSG